MTWTIKKKIFVEFLTVLLPFYVLVFWPQDMWDLSSSSRDVTHTPALEGEVLTTGTPGRSLSSPLNITLWAHEWIEHAPLWPPLWATDVCPPVPLCFHLQKYLYCSLWPHIDSKLFLKSQVLQSTQDHHQQQFGINFYFCLCQFC